MLIIKPIFDKNYNIGYIAKHSFFCILCLFYLVSVHAKSLKKNHRLQKEMQRLVSNGCLMLHNEMGDSIIRYHADRVLIPASLFKIITSLAAFDILSPDYRFPTKFYISNQNDLLIEGYGDPLLISEEIERMAIELKKQNHLHFRSLFLDHSRFVNLDIPGVFSSSRPYDALNGALVVNFNTISLYKNSKGKIYSGEKTTPLTPFAIKKGHYIRRNERRRINLGHNFKDSLQYSAELFTVLFKKHGIKFKKKGFKTTVYQKKKWKLFHISYSRYNLRYIITQLLTYSNNFIANQVYLTIGALKNGYPASLSKSKNAMNSYLFQKLKILPEKIKFNEASGISKDVKIQCDLMMDFMERFRPYANLLPRIHGVLAKSGTLTWVYNYAGYLEKGNMLWPFVIITNQKKYSRNLILKKLKKYVSLL